MTSVLISPPERERYAAARCSDPDLGQDAFQDAMLDLMGNLDAYRGDAPIEPWLRRLVVGACSRLRRGRKNAPASGLPLVEDRVDQRPNAELQMELQEELTRIATALRSLSELNRQLIYLHEGEGLSIRELEERFELSADAIKSRLKRARVQMRRNLSAGSAA